VTSVPLEFAFSAAIGGSASSIPGQLAALARELVAHPCVLLLALQQLLARRLPFLVGADPVIRHRGCLRVLVVRTAAGARCYAVG
jgi:hypothetical protein